MWFYFLSLILVGCFCVLIFKYYWPRRRFYKLSWTMHGPFAWPYIGNANAFIDSDKSITNVTNVLKQYTSPVRFWLGPKLVVVFDRPEEIELIMNSPKSIDKGVYDNLKYIIGGHGLFTSGGETWKAHRKLLNPTIQNYHILASFYPIFNKNMKRLVELLESKVGKGSFDVYCSLEACTMDMICETTFGVTVNVQEGKNTYTLDAAYNLMHLTGILIFQPWYQFKPLFRMSKYYKMALKCRRDVKRFAQKIIDKKIDEFKNKKENDKMENESTEVDEFGIRRLNIFIDECVRLYLERKCFTEEDVMYESLTMLGGGFETTAITASYVVLMLALHPEYQEKVFQEIRSIFPDQRSDITAEDITKLEYTDRFIKETMRFTPTVPLITRLSKQDMQIGEHLIPAGIELIISVFNLHRNPLVWGEKASVFDPDHFLPENLVGKHRSAFIPFSSGARNCIGMKYGNIVLRLFVCWLVRNYRFTSDLKVDELKFRMNVTMKLVDKHMVHVHKREDY